MRTHLFPFYSYDVPHTCGPDPKICCQFDFRRLPGLGPSCPWNVPPVKITESNVNGRAFTLYDQYRKKSQLYKTNVLLIPLGDDFRYDTAEEWTEQHQNYVKLFEEMNKNPEWNVHARFGTLSDYFNELDKSLRTESQSLPVLSGDFFTYADRDDHYWSGYFTSRPFYKQMDRVLQHQLRAAEIALTLKFMKDAYPSDEVDSGDVRIFAKLVQARRALSLFQHHDGVTGTAKDHVVVDYGKKMLAALEATEAVLSDALCSLLSTEAGQSSAMVLDEYRTMQDALPTRKVYSIGDFVILFNTLSRSRDEPTCIQVASISAVLRTDSGREIKQQMSPVFELIDGYLVPSKEKYELCFVDNLKPFGVSVYKLVESSTNGEVTMATLTAKGNVKTTEFKFEPVTGNTFTSDNSLILAEFDTETGFLKSVTPSGHKKIDTNVRYVHYGVREHKKLDSGNADNLSGAYLFLPDGEAKELPRSEQDFVVVDGPIMKRVYVAGPSDLSILHVYSLAHGSPSLEITNEVDIRNKKNFELAMRIETNLIKRKRLLGKLPVQAHFYPMPASAHIEDSSTRVSLLGNQALGVASLESGQIEVILDRRLNQDDGRGLFQGVLDNHRTLSRFRLLVEPLTPPDNINLAEERVSFYSMVGLAQSMELHYPTIRMLSKAKPTADAMVGITEDLPCDVHIVSLRTSAGPTNYVGNGMAQPLREAALVLHRPLTDCRSKLQLQSDCTKQENAVLPRKTSAGPTNYVGNGMAQALREAALVLHRPLTDCRSKLQLQSDCTKQENAVMPKKLFPNIQSVAEASLTLLYEGKPTDTVALEPQDVVAVKLSW
ncbi:glycosyl hydrolase family 38 protein [Oesophagostomum dentatum]|uniref:Alpha-mannosidase n=1 Tax=Oesophagostomum dentatum TaxID=61180 RepID=A0A0B1TCU2_OESDE|nr:glycosyl hydrolase family 38 protein [Oesophagostomum dentatum]